MNAGNMNKPTLILQKSKPSAKTWLLWTAAMSPMILLLGFWTLFPPARLSRLDIESLPKSPFGFVQADNIGTRGKPNGIDNIGSTSIIFVHGLGSDPDTTWSSWVKDPTHKETYIPVCWVRELLPDDIPPQHREDVRLFFYNHDTHFWRDSPQSSLETLASSMLSQLQSQIRKTDDEWTRKLIFVGHSYGGLIIKQAIAQASESDNFRNIIENAKAFVFLGTPHLGSKSSRIGHLLAYLLRFQGSNTNVVGGLGYDNNDLRRLQRRWLKITDKKRVVNFYEERKSPRVGKSVRLFSSFVVEPQSATYDTPSDRAVENIPLPLNHFELNKFHQRDQNYRIVKDKINELIASPVSLQEARLFLVPTRRVSNYVERPNLSAEVERKLRIKHKNSQVPYSLLIRGLGGTGKSQLALNYIREHKHEFDAIFWIDAENEESTRRSFLEFTKLLKLHPDQGNVRLPQELDSISIAYVLEWFEKRLDQNQKWLAIIDNADDVRWGIKRLIPQGLRGSIIITSQDSRAKEMIDGSCEEIEVGTMNDSEAQLLLLKNLGLSSDSITDKIQRALDALLRRLGGLPIALDLASVTIRNYNSPVAEALSEYVTVFDKFRDQILLDESSAGLTFNHKTVWTVWNTALHNVDSYFSNPKPSFLLAFLAHFRGSIIQDNIFRFASLGLHRQSTDDWRKGFLPSELHSILTVRDNEWEPFYYRRAKDALIRYHLLQSVSGDEAGVTMHSLVRWRARLHNPGQEWSHWNFRVLVKAIDAAYHPNGVASSAWYITDHLAIDDEFLDSRGFDWKERTSLRLHIGAYYQTVGEFSKCESILLPGITMFQTQFEHSRATIDQSDVNFYIESLRVLSAAYRNMGDLEKSEDMGMAALQMHMETARPDGYKMLGLMNNLALTYEDRREYSSALNMQAEALRVGEELLEVITDDHPQWSRLRAGQLSLRGNMATNYLRQSRLQEAEDIITSGLAESKYLHGDEHSETLRFMNLLGHLYSLRGFHRKAVQSFETNLEIAKRVAGPHSPFVFQGMKSLATLYRHLNQDMEAAKFLFDIVQLEEKEKGLEHTDTLDLKISLGEVLLRLNRPQEAVQLLAPALSTSKKVHGAKSPLTVELMKIQSIALMEQGQDGMMMELLNSEPEMFEMVWKSDRKTPVEIMCALHHEHMENERTQQAEALLTRTVEVSRKAFGTYNKKTLYLMYTLMKTRILVNRSFLVLDDGKEAVEISERLNGPDDASTLILMETLNTAYRLRNNIPGAVFSSKCPA